MNQTPSEKQNKFYEAGPLKRKRRTNAQIEQLDRQIYDVLSVDHPQSVRHVFYRMTDPRLPEPVDKSDKGYELVQRRCVQMRRDGRLKYSWIAAALSFTGMNAGVSRAI